VDDNDNILLRFKGGAKGMLWASQVAPGNENALTIRVYGTKGGISWKQEEPNTLWFSPFGQPPRKITRGGAGVGAAAARMARVPSGHPEGYLEGFANIYSEVARAIGAARTGAASDPAVIFPTVEDGLKGMEFIEAALKSSAKGGVWVKL
jgi:predicted dehydrogenase